MITVLLVIGLHVYVYYKKKWFIGKVDKATKGISFFFLIRYVNMRKPFIDRTECFVPSMSSVGYVTNEF
jgi:hypothetical protein